MRANAFDSTLIKSFPSPTVCSTECKPDRYTLVRRCVSAQNLLVAIEKYLNSQKIYTQFAIELVLLKHMPCDIK